MRALDLGALDDDLRARITVLAGKAAGPASARNVGWRASRAPWIAFVDDDVVVGERWLEELAHDLRDAARDVAGSQGRITVPLPSGRRPTDWERNVAALETSQWITADCAYRRSELLAVGGFDERFRRAYREDADIALRIVARGKRIVPGARRAQHPPRPGRLERQRPAAGRQRRRRADASRCTDAIGARAPARRAVRSARTRRPSRPHRSRSRSRSRAAAANPRLCGAAYALLAARFAWRRIAPGPRTPHEIGAMALTSLVIPFAAVMHRLRGIARVRALLRDAEHAPRPAPARGPVRPRRNARRRRAVQRRSGARPARRGRAGCARAVARGRRADRGRVEPERRRAGHAHARGRRRGQRAHRDAARPAGARVGVRARPGRRLRVPQAAAGADRSGGARARRRAVGLRRRRRHRRPTSPRRTPRARARSSCRTPRRATKKSPPRRSSRATSRTPSTSRSERRREAARARGPAGQQRRRAVDGSRAARARVRRVAAGAAVRPVGRGGRARAAGRR